jgi:dienelactone hydrolase
MLPARADTLVLKGGKKLDGVVVSSGENGDPVVVNPYNSRCPDMTYGITDKEKYPRDKVAELTIADAPLVHYRTEASRPGLNAAEHLELAKFCEKNKLTEERDRELKLALCAEPDNTEALTMIGRAVWAAWAKGNPLADADLRELEAVYIKRESDDPEKKGGLSPAELQTQWSMMQEKGTTRSRVYLERARRSAAFPKGRRDKVPLTLRSELAPGGTYCIYLPKSYDPLVPTGLVVGLHGGGAGGADGTLVTGSGEEAMNFYVDVADERGVIVVCPTALQAQWPSPKNIPLVDAVIDEMKILYNVDESRIWLTGHSMGGWGSWWWGPQRANVWAAFAPCAGGGGSASDAKGLPVYIYHGTDDMICRVEPDRKAADGLLKEKADFVYTEIDKVGHGFPDFARKDIFRFFAGRWKDDGKKRTVWPKSSFDKKPSKDEIKCFGDPAATGAPANADDAKLGALIASLEKGGGRAVEAAKELATRKDAVVESLGALGGKDTVDPLVRAGKQFGVFFEKSNMGGSFGFTEYETRCQSFGRLCDAFAKAGDAAAVPVIEKEIVLRVYAPPKKYDVPIDSRFVEIPPRARRELMQKMAACLVALKDPRGKALLETAKTPWKSEGPLVAAADEAIGKL